MLATLAFYYTLLLFSREWPHDVYRFLQLKYKLTTNTKRTNYLTWDIVSSIPKEAAFYLNEIL